MKELSEESTENEVAYYFFSNFKINKDAKENIINEKIDGDVLLDLEDLDFKRLGVKLGPLKKIRTYLNENKHNFKEKKINEVITDKSKTEEVKYFFDKYLNFTENLNDLDGKKLLELDEDKMKSLGLKLGQRKKLAKYIKHFKTLIEKEGNENKLEQENKIAKMINNNNNDNILYLKKQNEEYKKKINILENKIKELENIIKEKDKLIIQEKIKNDNNMKELGNIPNNIENNRIKELEEEINLFKSYCLSPGEKLYSIKFLSIDQKINYIIPAKNTDNFSKVESLLYEKYPSYKDTENYFIVNGNKINRHRTVAENKIKNNDILTLGVIDE